MAINNNYTRGIFLFIFIVFIGCSPSPKSEPVPISETQDSVETEEKQEIKSITADDITIEKDLLYNKYTLDDKYHYKDTTRIFQWDKIKDRLAFLETIQQGDIEWGILRNYRNNNGEAPLVKRYERNEYKRIADTLGVERYQGIPLFLPGDTVTGERYGRDGTLIKLMNKDDSISNLIEIKTTDIEGKWFVPRKYVKSLADSTVFEKAIFVDVTNQNIATIEKIGYKWIVRSMNPATTGMHRPPYQQETPTGLFVVQEKKPKMFYLVDGTTEIAGFAPNASRFTNGGYIHGIPVNNPEGKIIEYSKSLGTTPRSHMCVRNATSHAQYVYDWAPVGQSVVFVID